MSTKRRVAYFYDSEIGNYHYGQGHPMKVICSSFPKLIVFDTYSATSCSYDA